MTIGDEYSNWRAGSNVRASLMSTPRTRVFPAAAAGHGPRGPGASAASATISTMESWRRASAERIISNLLCAWGEGRIGRSSSDFDPAPLARREVDGVDHGLHGGPVAERRVVGRL